MRQHGRDGREDIPLGIFTDKDEDVDVRAEDIIGILKKTAMANRSSYGKADSDENYHVNNNDI